MILAGLFGFAWDLVVFVIALSILILIHELGHFFFAKLFKVYCYEFSLGMGPVLVQRERKNDETKYSIRAFPIGGYVAMAGESTEEDNSVPFERTINGVASWKKMIIVIAGVMMNFILAFILFVGIFLSIGTPSNKYKLQVTNDGIAYEAGLRTGDIINNISSMIVENGEDDIYNHDCPNFISGQDYLEKNLTLYVPSMFGAEKACAERLAEYKKIKAEIKANYEQSKR